MRLDELEPVEKDKQYFRPRSELYYWPLSLALALAAAVAMSKVKLS
jgi:Ca-activated chloride channel family protein